MHFLLYNKVSEAKIEENLGFPEYSYFFVYREFKQIFQEFGDVTSVGSEEEIQDVLQKASETGSPSILVCFCPPHVAPIIEGVDTFCVVAWEFDTVPDEVWDDNPSNNWLDVLSRHIGVICLSGYSQSALRKRLPEDFPVASIPVPVWERFGSETSGGRSRNELTHQKISVRGSVIDSSNYLIGEDVFEIKDSITAFSIAPWDGSPLEFGFTQKEKNSAFLGGFYHAEPWGTWSRLQSPWLLLQCMVYGDIELTIVARGYGCSVGKEISIAIGGAESGFVLQADVTTYVIELKNVAPDNVLRFVGLDLTPTGNPHDQRSMAIGLHDLKIKSLSEESNISVAKANEDICLTLDGVVYTTVFNPADARKCWHEIVTAFCFAFREQSNATLVLKVSHRELSSIIGKLHFLLQQIGPMKCRVLAIHGYLTDENYCNLIESTDFYVNASTAEGLCLPLMEFMAKGVPAISPKHTAMSDYIETGQGHILECSQDIAIWPQDSRLKKRARSYRVNWESLVDSFQRSYEERVYALDKYQGFSSNAREAIKSYSNKRRVVSLMAEYLAEIKPKYGSK